MFRDASRISSATAWRSSSFSLHILEASIIGIFSRVVDSFELKVYTLPVFNVTVLKPFWPSVIVVVWDILKVENGR